MEVSLHVDPRSDYRAPYVEEVGSADTEDRTKERARPMKVQDLTLVGLTDDKQKLVLVSDAGEEFTLPADARLRAALRGEHARFGQLEITMDSALRPRDIQARIRAGESPEHVAAAAQTTLDKVMSYATPVLAERAYIAQRAQLASVRRRGGEGVARPLADAVAERLRRRNVDPESVEWDAWRREDGRWTLAADYRSGESNRHAEFTFDAPGRYVVAEDDEARWLVGEQSSRKGPQPRSTPGPRRLSSVTGGVEDEDELPLGEDAIGMVTGDLVSGEPETPDQPTEEPAGEEPAGTGDADWIARPAAPDPVEPDPVEHPVELGSEADPEVAGDQPEESERPRPARKSRRPSVPSWDEIMFGGGKPE